MMSKLPKLQWDHWHIEVSSICTLKCPRCPRKEVSDTLLNRQLSLDFFINQLGESTIEQIKKITFCGNDGDPIYCKDFLEIVQWIKKVNPKLQLVIITNGSHKLPEWWEKLAYILNENDSIHWSLDGWDQSSNEKYRINCNWDSIIDGIKSFNKYNKTTYKVWASIAFAFNQNSLDLMREAAKKWDFDRFQLTLSTKFGSVYSHFPSPDPLEPTLDNLISKNHRFTRRQFLLSDKKDPDTNMKKIFLDRSKSLNNQSGICLIGNKGVFLNSQGEFFPCCWVANRFEHNREWIDLAKNKFNLNQRTFKEIISDNFWTEEFLTFKWQECKTKCTKEKLSDLEHVTEW